MKKILFLMITALLFLGCSGGDELEIDTQIWYIARDTNSGNNVVSGTFCFFKDGDYNPATFEHKFYSSPSNVWEDASIKTENGETVKSFFTDIVLKDKGNYGTYKCEPGTYYLAVLVNSKSTGEIWKAQKVTVEKNKITKIDAVFKDMYTSGYVEWNE